MTANTWCDYEAHCAGYTQPALEAFHLEWEKDWQLIERLVSSITQAKQERHRRDGISEEEDVLQKTLRTRSFSNRSGTATQRCHQQYGLIAEEVAKQASVDVHMGAYSDWALCQPSPIDRLCTSTSS